jgi:hypothetical protein
MIRRIILSFFLAGLASSALSANITIDPTGLAGQEVSGNFQPRDYNAFSLIGVSSFFRGETTFDLSDGTYSLFTGGGSGISVPFGTFTVSGGQVVSATDSLLVQSSDTVGFDLAQLGRVEFDSAELITNVNGSPVALTVALYGASNILRGRTFVHLPDGDGYNIITRLGASYGSFGIAGGNLVDLTGALSLAGGVIHFDQGLLAPTRVLTRQMSDPAGRLNIMVREIRGAFLDDHILFLPPFEHQVLLSSPPAQYGTISVASDLTVTAAAGITDLGVDQQAGITHRLFEVDQGAAVTINLDLSVMSDPPGLVSGGLTNQFGVAGQTTPIRLSLSDTLFNGNPVSYTVGVTRFNDVSLGAFDLEAGAVTGTTGYLVANGNDITVDVCQLNQIQFDPADGEAWRAGDWGIGAHLTTAASLFVPTGESVDFQVRQTPAHPTINALVSPTTGGLVFSGDDFTGLLTVTVETAFCTPPDDDLDGVVNDLDICPGTSQGDPVDAVGCSIAQRVDLACDQNSAVNHGRHVSCVAQFTQSLVKSGEITRDQRRTLLNSTAHK